VIIRSAQFEISAVRPLQWPVDGLPEFAFIGRSNVGKSSLLNRLLGRKALARVSQKPGKTQQINFFCINQLFRFVDLPGYGYAAVSKTDRQLFIKLIDTYVNEREPLLRVLQLVDIRHDPSREDVAVHQFLQSLGWSVCVVATKSDKISKSAVKLSVANIRKVLQTGAPILPVSSEKNTGIDPLWDLLQADLDEAASRASETSVDEAMEETEDLLESTTRELNS
jgi:GTP-binding protein